MTHLPIEQLVNRALRRQALAEISDAILLERFVADRDGSAFTELVERYAALVLGICRRVMGSAHPALDDAFQETFVTLGRKAASIRGRDRLPAWLHSVSRRIAWRFRTAKPNPATGELPDLPSNAPSPSDRAQDKEWLTAVEAEVARLPEKYRAPVLLCWFDDGSLEQAARQLGLSKGTLWGRLKRARDLLRRRLAGRGFGLPMVLAAGISATAVASPRLITQTVDVALRGALEQATGTALTASATLALVKVAGGLSLAATILIGAVALLPARAPEPAREPAPKNVDLAAARDATASDGFPLPPGAIHRFGNRQFRHPDGVVGSAISPDGKYLATLGSKSVIVWDVKTQAARQIFRDSRLASYGMDVSNVRLTFLPDSRSIAVTLENGRVDQLGKGELPLTDIAVVWDIETGKEKFTLTGHSDELVAVWVCANGKELATVASGKARFYDAGSGKELKAVSLKDDAYQRTWVAPAADRIAVHSAVAQQPGLVVSEARTGKEIFALPNTQVVQAALSVDGKRLAVHDNAGKVRIYDPDAQKELLSFDHPAQGQMAPMHFSKNDQTLYFGGQHGQLFRWDIQNNKRLPDPGRHATWTLLSMALSPDESILYSMGWNRVINRWDLKTGKQLPTAEGYTTQTVVCPTSDGKQAIIADHAGIIDCWDLASGRPAKRLQASGFGIDCMAITADGRWLATGRTIQDVQIWDLQMGKVSRTIPLADNPAPRGSDHVKRVAFSADGRVLFTGSARTGVTAWDPATGRKVWNAAGIGHLFAADPNGRFVAVTRGYVDQKPAWTILRADTGAIVRQVDVPADGPVNDGELINTPLTMDVAAMTDGRFVTTHIGRSVRVWDPEAGKELLRLNGTGTGGLAVSRDGKWLAVRGEGYDVQLWELLTGKRLRTFAGIDSQARDLCFTRDGKGLFANADLSPTLWSVLPVLPARNDPTASLWDSLAADDGKTAFEAQWQLAREPKETIAMFKEKVKPDQQTLDRREFDNLTAKLDDPQFRVREAAEKELARAGYKAPVDWLRQARDKAKSAEQASRLTKLLTLREKLTAPEWQIARAVQTLELTGTREALELLRLWSEAPKGSLLAVEAKAALTRLTPSGE